MYDSKEILDIFMVQEKLANPSGDYKYLCTLNIFYVYKGNGLPKFHISDYSTNKSDGYILGRFGSIDFRVKTSEELLKIMTKIIN